MNYSLISPLSSIPSPLQTSNKSNVRKNETGAKVGVFNFSVCLLVLFLRPGTIYSVCLAPSANGSNLIMSLRCCHKILWQYPDHRKLTAIMY